jgi:hypothetical protein
VEESTTIKTEGKPRVRYEIPPWIAKDQVPKVFPAFIAANRAIEAVSKSRKNTQQHYNFRGIDQVYDMIHGVLADAGLVTVPVVLQRLASEQKSKSGSGMSLVEMESEYWCYAEDGSALVIGPLWSEALDMSDKATNKAMAFAQKYALLQTFTIPTSDVSEGDRETIERGTNQPRQQQAPQQQQAQEPTQDGASDLISDETAAKVYQAFGALGVTREQLHAKLGQPVAKTSLEMLGTLSGWRNDIEKDKRNAARIFGEPAAQARADALNGPPAGT